MKTIIDHGFPSTENPAFGTKIRFFPVKNMKTISQKKMFAMEQFFVMNNFLIMRFSGLEKKETMFFRTPCSLYVLVFPEVETSVVCM